MKRQLLTIVYASIFLWSGYKLIMYFYTYYETNESLATIQQVYQPTTETTNLRQSFAPLLTINPAIVGWVQIEGTLLNNPILQSGDNDYYLERNYLGDYSRAGSIFMDYRNDVVASRHTILYGHAMRNGTMFGDLHRYADQTYADQHPRIIFDTLYERYEVEIFAAYETNISFDYIKTVFSDEVAYADFLQQISTKSQIITPVEMTAIDDLFTLSTCSSRTFYGDERFVVHGKIIKK